MRDFIVNFGSPDEEEGLLAFSFALARQCSSYVTGVRVVSFDASLVFLPDALGVLEDEVRAAKARVGWFKERCRETGVEGGWEVLRGSVASCLARRSSLADAVIGSLSLADAQALLGSGELDRMILAHVTPVILVPYRWRSTHPVRRIVVAWNGSAEAARAVKAALPLLSLASEVKVLDGTSPATNDLSPTLPLREWLRRRNVPVTWQAFHPSQDVGAAIDGEARDMDADLLVMGAWGRSRIHELVRGGVTRYCVQNSSTPLLLAH